MISWIYIVHLQSAHLLHHLLKFAVVVTLGSIVIGSDFGNHLIVDILKSCMFSYASNPSPEFKSRISFIVQRDELIITRLCISYYDKVFAAFFTSISKGWVSAFELGGAAG